MLKWVTDLLGSNERELKKLRPLVECINALEPGVQKLEAADFKAKTEEFRERLGKGESLDSLLPEAFALAREAARRTVGMRHFDVQLVGGIVLHQGEIAEMATGEGKTLVATLPAYLNTLGGQGVHIVTVNDYLAKRDTRWMGPIYHLLGLSVSCLQHEASYLYDPDYPGEDPSLAQLRPLPRRQAYQADVLYGTNHEFGFDYLRDNMAIDLSQRAQRELYYAIVDEVDNILIDEARTPLIISGPADESTQKYYLFARLVSRLTPGEDFTTDEKARTASLTDMGIAKMEKWLGVPNLYAPDSAVLSHYIDNALRARVYYKRDRDYMVREGEVIIVDEFTGRLMLGRRYSEGLHQAIEAQEGLKIRQESLTLATVTLQNYFRMYKKLAGMTGTAATEAEEFYKIYKLDVLSIPPNIPLIRHTFPDRIYKTEEAKFKAVAEEIEELYKERRPVLVGTISIEKSEHLSELLKRKGVPHQVLNARHHEKEAAIVAQAGRLGAVTIATNMAGRGTDIILGGNPAGMDISQEEWQKGHEEVVALGGLHILGTERHEARRIDNQLRGRSGRQGDPGSSRFYTALEDDLLRRFGGERIKGVMEWAGMDDHTPIENPLVAKAIESAQVKTEAQNFEIRKHLLEYDDVLNKQREVIYGERQKILEGVDLKANVQDMLRRRLHALVETYYERDGDATPLLASLRNLLPLPPSFDGGELEGLSKANVEERLEELALALYGQKEKELGPENMRAIERLLVLRTIDSFWVEHLTALDNMRQGIGLQAYGQSDPLVAYKRQAHMMFEELKARLEENVVRSLLHLTVGPAPKREPVAVASQPSSREGKVGRNDPCPCGSGKKYKKCHGR